MKITKKDVAGEGLIHMQGVSRKAEGNPNTDEDYINPQQKPIGIEKLYRTL